MRIAAVCATLLAATWGWGQTNGQTTSTQGSSSGTGSPTSSQGSNPSQPPARPVPQVRTPATDRAPLNGKVVLDNGTPPPEPARVETACGTRTTVLAYTDSKGGFSGGLSVGQFTDVRSSTTRPQRASPASSSAQNGTDCSIRAILPGYRSTEVSLALHTGYEPITLILRPVTDMEGHTVSASTLEAPKPALAAYAKAGREIQKGKWSEAHVQLEKAVAIYPRYAEAWSVLGDICARLKDPVEARHAWRQAVTIDPKFVYPFFGLAEDAMHTRNWTEMAALTATLIKLDPYDFPAAYAYDAMAQLNLGNLEAAEHSARQGLRIDGRGAVPKNEHLLGVVLMKKRDFQGAAEHLRKYLETGPDTEDAEFVAKQIAVCEERGRLTARQR